MGHCALHDQLTRFCAYRPYAFVYKLGKIEIYLNNLTYGVKE